MRNKKRNDHVFIHILQFLIIFAILFALEYLFVFKQGKTILYHDDCVADFYETAAFKKSCFQEFWNNLLHGSFSIPYVNYNLTSDSNNMAFIVSGYEIFDVIYWLVPVSAFEVAFVAIQFLRQLSAGLAFLLFCKQRKKDWDSSLLGSIIYVFSAYCVIATIKQPGFIQMFYCFPLIIAGVEAQIQKKSPWLMIVACAFSFCCSEYFMYYISWNMIFYVVVRVLLQKKKKWRTLLSLAGSYLIGLGLSAFMMFPTIIDILSSGRLGWEIFVDNWFYYDLSAQWSDFIDFFRWKVPSFGHWSFYGILAIALYPILYSFSSKKYRPWRYLFVVTVLFINLPFIGRVLGLNLVNNRWCFSLPFVAGGCVVETMPEMIREKSTRKKLSMNIAAVVLLILTITHIVQNPSIGAWLYSGMIVLCILIMNLIWGTGLPYRYSRIVILALCAVFVVMNSGIVFGADTLSRYMDRSKVNAELDGYIDIAALDIDEDGFYRIDKDDCSDEMSCNLPFWYGYNGISSFHNMLNPNVIEYFQMSENSGILQYNKIYDLDRRFSDEFLASVGYFSSSIDNKIIPFGFTEFSQGDSYRLFRSSYFPSPIHFYGDTISKETFVGLNVAQQQEVLLQKLVLDHGESFIQKELEMDSIELSFFVVDSVGFEKKVSGEWVSNAKKGTISIIAELPENSEIYIELENTHKSGSGTSKVNVIADDDRQNNTIVQGERVERRTGQPSIAVNMGSGLSAGEHRFDIMFSGNLDLSFENLHVYARPLWNVQEDIDVISPVVEKLLFDTNQISFDVTLDRDGYVLLSLPFNPGWRASVDGADVRLEKAQIMYMALQAREGNHHIVLQYSPRGMTIGVTLSILCLLLVLTAAFVEGRRRGRHASNHVSNHSIFGKKSHRKFGVTSIKIGCSHVGVTGREN